MALGRRRRLDRTARERGIAPEPEVRERDRTVTTGPYDAEDVAVSDTPPRIDLGALRVPVVAGGELRLDMDKAGTIVSVTVRVGGSTVTLSAFAAPRGGGLWAEVRPEILATVRAQGGKGTETEGPLGPELECDLAMQTGSQPVRFLGVDGPRWFLRALMSGPAARDAGLAEPLLDILRGVVVARGTDPRPVREQLPLQLPPGAAVGDPVPAP